MLIGLRLFIEATPTWTANRRIKSGIIDAIDKGKRVTSQFNASGFIHVGYQRMIVVDILSVEGQIVGENVVIHVGVASVNENERVFAICRS